MCIILPLSCTLKVAVLLAIGSVGLRSACHSLSALYLYHFSKYGLLFYPEDGGNRFF